MVWVELYDVRGVMIGGGIAECRLMGRERDGC